MNGFELLKLFVTLEVRGRDEVSRQLKEIETEGETAEERLGGIGDTSEKSAKKTEGSLKRIVRAIGGVRKEAGAASKQVGADFERGALQGVRALEQLRDALRAAGDEAGALKVQADIDQASFRAAKAQAASLGGRETLTLDVDSKRLRGASESVEELTVNMTDLRRVGAATLTTLPAFVALLGGIPAAAGAGAVGTGQLAVAVGQLGTALGLIGGAAMAAAIGGLRAYQAVVSQTVSDSREAYLATHEKVAQQLEEERQTILNTRANVRFNEELNRMILFLTRVEAGIGRQVLPAMTRWMQTGRRLLPTLTPPLFDLVDGVTEVIDGLLRFATTRRSVQQIGNILDFVAEAGTLAAAQLSNLLQVGLRFAPWLIRPARELLNLVNGLLNSFHDWAMSAQGVATIGNIVSVLWTRMRQGVAIVFSLGKGLFGVVRILEQMGASGAIAATLVQISRGFASIAQQGSAANRWLTTLALSSQAPLRQLWLLVVEGARQFAILTMAIIRARDSSNGLSLLASFLKAIRVSLLPLRQLFQSTLLALGPELIKLIPNLALLAQNFAGSTGTLVRFLANVNRLLSWFNALPAPVRSAAAEFVAFNAALRTVGGPSITGLIGGLGSLLVNMRMLSTTSRIAALQQRQLALASGQAAAATSAGGAAAASSAGRFGILSVAARGLGVALRFMLGPWGLLITAVATGAVLIVKNWDKIRPALQPVFNLFNVGKRIVQTFAQIIGSVFSGNTERARRAIMSLPGPLRQAGVTVARLTAQVRAFATAALRWLLQQAQRMASWWRSNLPLMQRTAQTVFRAIGAVVRAVFGPLLTWVRNNQQQLLSILRSVWNIIRRTISTAVRILGNVIKLGMQVITGDWRGAWQTVLRIGQLIWRNIEGNLRDLWNILKNIFQIGGRTLLNIWRTQIWDPIWNWAKARAADIGQVIENLKQKALDIFNSLPGPVKAIFQKIGQAMTDPIGTARDLLFDIWNGILEFIANALEKIGAKDLAETVRSAKASPGGEGGGRRTGPGSGRAPERGSPSGRFGFARGGIATEPSVFGEAGPEAAVPLTRRTREGQMAARAVLRSPNSPLSLRRDEGERPHVHRRAEERERRRQMRRGPRSGLPRGSQEGFGPTMYTWIEPMQDLVNAVKRRFPVSANTYSNHPPGYAQPYYRERSADFWAESGRGSPIGSFWPSVADYAAKLAGPALNWILHPGNDPAGHGGANAHVHTTAFAQGGRGGGAVGGAGPSLGGLFVSAWNRAVQPKIERLVEFGSGSVLTQGLEGYVEEKVFGGVRDWLASRLGGTGTSPAATGDHWQWHRGGLSYGGAFPATDANASKLHDLAMQESTDNPSAKNASGASGLMQMMPDTFAAHRVHPDDDIMNPVHNTAASTRYQEARYGRLVTFSPYSEGGIARRPHIGVFGEGRYAEGVVPMVDDKIRNFVRGVGGIYGPDVSMLAERLESLTGALVREGIVLSDVKDTAAEKVGGAAGEAARAREGTREWRDNVQRVRETAGRQRTNMGS